MSAWSHVRHSSDQLSLGGKILAPKPGAKYRARLFQGRADDVFAFDYFDGQLAGRNEGCAVRARPPR